MEPNHDNPFGPREEKWTAVVLLLLAGVILVIVFYVAGLALRAW